MALSERRGIPERGSRPRTASRCSFNHPCGVWVSGPLVPDSPRSAGTRLRHGHLILSNSETNRALKMYQDALSDPDIEVNLSLSEAATVLEYLE